MSCAGPCTYVDPCTSVRSPRCIMCASLICGCDNARDLSEYTGVSYESPALHLSNFCNRITCDVTCHINNIGSSFSQIMTEINNSLGVNRFSFSGSIKHFGWINPKY